MNNQNNGFDDNIEDEVEKDGNDNESKQQQQNQRDKTLDSNSNFDYQQQFRSSLRSKVLQRIYDKNKPSSSSSSENINDNRNSTIIDDDNPYEKITEKEVRRHLSNDEWSKTLERVMHYQTDNFRKKLEVSRKDGLEFFLKHQFDDNDNDNDERMKKKKHRKKLSSKSGTSLKIVDYFGNKIKYQKDSKKSLVKRMSKLKLNNDYDEDNRNSIIVFDVSKFDNDNNMTMVGDNCTRFGYRQSCRLLREHFDLSQLNDNRLFSNIEKYFQRCSIKVPQTSTTTEEKLKIFRNFRPSMLTNLTSLIINDSSSKFSKQQQLSSNLNNDRFILSIDVTKLSFLEHPSMNYQQKLFRKLRFTYHRFRKLNSLETEFELNQINAKIDLVMTSLVNSSDDNRNSKTMKEYQMDCNLLERLLGTRQNLVENRRKTLIELLECWSEIEEKNNRSEQMDLILEETESVNPVLEKEQFDQIVKRDIEARKFIIDLGNRGNSGNDNEMAKSQFLDDGRLPGEPKFAKIELIETNQKKSKNKLSQDIEIKSKKSLDQQLFYSVQIKVGAREYGHIKPIRLKSDADDDQGFDIEWSQPTIVRVPIVPPPPSQITKFPTESSFGTSNIQYRPLISNDKSKTDPVQSDVNLGDQDDDDDDEEELPTISIFENNSETKLIYRFQISMKNFPDFNVKSREQAMIIEETFVDQSKSSKIIEVQSESIESKPKSSKKNKKTSLPPPPPVTSGTIRYSLFWTSIPANILGVTSTIFDPDIQKIPKLNNIELVDQWLHDIRYSMLVDTTGLSSTQSFQKLSNKNLQLLDLLLRQKYQLELTNLTTTTTTTTTTKMKDRESAENLLQKLPLDGTFCTDEEIESDKRFQLMIQRNQGQSQYRHLRFIPLNQSDILPTILHDTSEKLSLDILLEFVLKSCQLQRKRLLTNEDRRNLAANINDDQHSDKDSDIDDQTDGSTTRRSKKKKKNKKSKILADNDKEKEEENEREWMLPTINHEWCILKQNQRYSMNWARTAQKVWSQIVNHELKTKDNDDADEDNNTMMINGINSVKQILNEPHIDSFSTAGFVLFPWLELFTRNLGGTSHGKLNPSRKDRRKSAITISDAMSRESIQIVLVIQQATNVPLIERRTTLDSGNRSNTDSSGSSSSMSSEDSGSQDSAEEESNKNLNRSRKRAKRRQKKVKSKRNIEFNKKGPKFGPCSTMVEIRLDNQQQQTTVADGSQPTWNENFKFQSKFDPNKQIYLNLFEVDTNETVNAGITSNLDPISNGQKDSETESKSESESEDSAAITSTIRSYSEAPNSLQLRRFNRKRWLGQLRIPLISLLYHSKIEGTFNLYSPYFLTGFRNNNQNISGGNRKQTRTKSGIDRMASTVEQAQRLLDTTTMSSFDCLGSIGLSLFVITDPPIESIGLVPRLSHSSEIESRTVLDHCNRWNNSLLGQHPRRHFLSLVHNLHGEPILCCRFLSPIKPPELSELLPNSEFSTEIDPNDSERPQSASSQSSPLSSQSQSSKRSIINRLKRLIHKDTLYLNLVIRYVSLLPISGPGPSLALGLEQKTPIWFDCYQLLTFRTAFGGQSGPSSSSILLCCFLLYLGRNVALVVGDDLLDGGGVTRVILFPSRSNSEFEDEDEADDNEESDEVEVVHRSRTSNSAQPIIIDAQSGHWFSVADHRIPMTSVHCVVTRDNVFANVQKQSHPNRIQFNLHKTSHWNALFTEKDYIRLFSLSSKSSFTSGNEDGPIGSIEPDRIRFGPIYREAATNLETRLEHYLRQQFVDWRRQLTGSYTPFNRHCTQIVKRLLPRLEYHCCLEVGASRWQFSMGRQTPTRTTSRNQPTDYQLMMNDLEHRFLEQLQQIYDIHQIIGYPIHVQNTEDFEQISRLVRSIGLHGQREPNGTDIQDLSPTLTLRPSQSQIEFVVCCHVQPYPGNLHSIWIYLAALLPKLPGSSTV